MLAFLKSWIKIIVVAFTDKYFLTWFIPLITIAVIIVSVLFEMLGFDHTFQISHLYSQSCRNLNDKEALAMLIVMFVALLSAVMTVGELIIFADNRRQGYPINYFSFIGTSCTTILALTATFVMTAVWCR
ncbi:hypothetical protein ACO0K0_03595 [Undibacterium sp. SXout11W]|uniref:hypothetical protein n=1 Tax=Undibacterium sp. SXout11W TaxID=3413050 RepID=UPI003BF18028